LTKEIGNQGELAEWLSDAAHKAEVEKANTLVLAKGINFNNDDIDAINKLGGNIKHLDIDAHQGGSTTPIDNANFESIDFTDMESHYIDGLASKLIKCNEKQVVAYPISSTLLHVECNAGSGNQGFIASQEAFFTKVYPKTNISKIIVKGEINAEDVKAINKATIDVINMDDAVISEDDLDFSGNTSVKYIMCPHTWPNTTDHINTKAFSGCTNLLAASALSTDGTKVLGYCYKAGSLKEVLNGSNYSELGNQYTSSYGNIKTAILAGNINHDDIVLCNKITELNLSQAIISSDDCYGDNSGWGGQGGTLEKLTLPTDASYTKIKDGAFAIVNLKEVNISTNVKEIGKSAFAGCTNLPKFLDLVNTKIETIGESAFENCKQITYIRFPESLKRIETKAFLWHDCEVLRIPRNVEYIGTLAFRSSGGNEAGTEGQEEQLKDVYFQGAEAPTVEKDAFGAAAYTGYNGYTEGKGGYSERKNYINNNKWFAVLHYRPDLTEAQIAKYVDVTRNYYYKDLYLGEQRTWPTQTEFNLSYGTEVGDGGLTDQVSNKQYAAGTYGATNSHHFDGTAFSDDEKTRIGIYQFVLTRNDAPIPDLDNPDVPDIPLNINDDDWWTICLPFSLSKEQVQEVFGEDTKLYTLGSVTRDKAEKKIHLYFTKNVLDGDKDGGETIYGNKLYDGYDETGIKAWYPYVIKPSKDFGGKTAVVDDYKIEAGSEKDVVIKAEDEYANIGENNERGIGWYYVFRGNCSGIVNSSLVSTQSVIYRPDNCYFLGLIGSKPAFMYQSNPKVRRAFAPYTCAIMAYQYLGASESDQQVVHFVDDSFIDEATSSKVHEAGSLMEFEDSTTPVESIEIVTPDKAVNGNIYNLNGQLVKKNVTTLDGLTKGIYIVNGKKFIVK